MSTYRRKLKGTDWITVTVEELMKIFVLGWMRVPRSPVTALLKRMNGPRADQNPKRNPKPNRQKVTKPRP